MTDEAPRLPDIVYSIEEQTQTLSVLNFAASDRVAETLADYFADQSVTLRRTHTADGVPKNFAVLHDGDDYVASSGLRDVYEAIRPDASLAADDSPEHIDEPDVLDGIDRTAFTSYDKARMVGASRLVERTAWRAGDAELHTGFQRLSKARDQWKLYTRLALSDVDVHVYGAPDWDVPPTDVTIHGYDDAEITRTWFVVSDHPDDAYTRALLAEEHGPNLFRGFWTDDSDVADTILTRLRQRFPATPADG
jgi:DICT domain-containing protein